MVVDLGEGAPENFELTISGYLCNTSICRAEGALKDAVGVKRLVHSSARTTFDDSFGVL